MALRVEDLFTPDDSSSYWSMPEDTLRRDLLRRALVGTLPNVPDVDMAESLTRLARNELTTFGTSGERKITDDEDIQLVLRACAACCDRVGVSFPKLPFRDFTTFRRYWIAAGMSGSYAARRDYLNQLFDPVSEELDGIAVRSWADSLARPISPHGATGWGTIDAELEELRRRFKYARTAQDHCAIGAACVRILEMVADAAFDPDIHLPPDRLVPSRGQTKERFGWVLEHHLAGADCQLWRRYARSVIDIAQEVKHRTTPDRMQAGVLSEAVIALAHMMRRITLS